MQILSYLGVALFFIAQIGGVALHLWTAYMAFRTGNFLLTAAVFLLPVFAELYWFVRVWIGTGDFINLYSLACFAIIGSYSLGTFLAGRGEEKEKERAVATSLPSPDLNTGIPSTEGEAKELARSLRTRLEQAGKGDQ